MSNEKFTVDTHLFRELGEMLVGRNSTALVELIKNSYDADAKLVTINGQNLSDPKSGTITITDDGIGMTEDQFRNGFLRIASRFKDSGNRKSLRLGRRFTGAKGIGRLAAHKLARFVEVVSRPDVTVLKNAKDGVQATIDWDKIENLETLDDILESEAISLSTLLGRPGASPGTTIRLKRIRKKWTPAELIQFQSEVESFIPPGILVDVPKGLVKGKLLFQKPKIADAKIDDPGISFQLLGDFATGDSLWPQVAASSHWLLEIDALSNARNIQINVLPTRLGQQKFPDARQQSFAWAHPAPKDGPFFQARVLIREGTDGDRAFQNWLNRSFGIRVYCEGFRVLPYGEPKNDWLSIDADYGARPKVLSFLNNKGFDESDDETEGLQILKNNKYFGAVFLTNAGAPELKMLINREGFIADESYERLVDIMRTAHYLSIRVRAAGKKEIREELRNTRRENQSVASTLELKEVVQVSVKRAAEFAQDAKTHAASGDYKAAAAKIEQAAAEFSRGSEASSRLMTEGTVLRVLASVGTQMAAFVHEINSILGISKAVETVVQEIENNYGLSGGQKKKLGNLRHTISELRRGIERQASYLTDVVSPDARRRRSRQRLSERFDAGVRLIAGPASRKKITIENEIPGDLKSPAMFPSELTVVFANLLTNAVKAASEHGRIRASGKTGPENESILRIENTGTSVNLKDAERWFRPFESTTIQTDPVLGQGMGMGLPITRNLLEEYGGLIRFVLPSRGFATALEITLPK